MLLLTANIFQPLIDVFEAVLKFFHDTGGIPWGWSIVLLTVGVRAILLPLTFRQIKGMVRMQAFGPQLKELQAKYKQDKARMNEEMMKFYRENNINPLASCLPLVAQFPVFIALYYMLRESLRNDICPGVQQAFQHAYAAKHNISFAAASGQTTACGSHGGSHFLFVTDLTQKATGVELAILIVLYVGSQLSSQLLMSNASMDPTQRKIMMFLPLVFVLFVIRFPAGLLVYWITTNLWTVGQQAVVKRIVGPSIAVAAPAGAAVATSGGGSSAGALTGGGGGSGGSGSGGSGGGGLGARLRDRLAAAQTQAEETRRSKATDGDGAKSGGGSTKTSSRSAGSPSSSASRRGDRSSKSTGNGSSTTASSSSGNGNGSAATPPRPPRKKKKRSGRRR